MNTETLEQSEKIAGSSTGCLRFVARPWKGWALLRNPFDGKKRSVRNRQPVQAELALDMVKPVRNDLNDTDLELIPARRVETTPAVEQVAVNKPVAVVEGLGAPQVSMTSRMMNLVGAWRGRLRMGLLKLRGGQT